MVFEKKRNEDVKGIRDCVMKIMKKASSENVKIVIFVNCCTRSDTAVSEKCFQNIEKAFKRENIINIFGGEEKFRDIIGEEGFGRVSNGEELT